MAAENGSVLYVGEGLQPNGSRVEEIYIVVMSGSSAVFEPSHASGEFVLNREVIEALLGIGGIDVNQPEDFFLDLLLE